jgi:catechol 2,3-dioxygenase-like lactoylglutathione lyase family enzyme
LAFQLTGCAAAPPPHAAAPAAPRPAAPSVAPARAGTPAASALGLRLGWPVWIGVVCDDFEAQRHFYRDVLGLTETNVSVYASWFQFDGKLLELLAKSERPQYRRPGVAVGFVVEDIQSARATLIERGVEAASEVEGDAGGHWAYFRDAEGNLFEIVEQPH